MAIREYFGPPCDSARILRVAADGGDEEPFSKGPPDRISVFSGGRSGPLAEILRVVLQNADRIEGRAVNDRESRFQAKQWRRWLEEFEADDED